MGQDEPLEESVARAREALPPPWSHPFCRNPHYLTRAEMAVLKLIGQGQTNEEIAKALFISRLTVRTHVKRIHSKTGVQGRARLAVIAAKIA